MYSIAILALLARLATAAPSIDFQLTPGKSPLDVIASITNTGDGDISVMKFAPILSTVPVKHFRVFDGQGDEVPFRGISAFFDIVGAGADAWETIPAGQTIVRSIDLSEFHEFKSAGQHTIWANGQFEVIPESQPTKTPHTSLQPYTKNLTISLTNDDVATSQRKFLQKRVSIGVCDGNKTEILRGDFAAAKQLAARAAERTRAPDSHFSQFFHTTDARTVGVVGNTFQKIGEAATVTTPSNITANCNGSPTVCVANIVAYASFFVGTEGEGNLFTCEPYWTFPRDAPTCSGYGRADVLVHELSHFYGTDDVAYGYGPSQQLAVNQAIRNADTYMFYSRSLAC